LERTEMRMLRWILGLTLRDRKRNDDIRRILGVVCITDKVREARLRWYGHVQRREEDSCVKRILEPNVGGQRSRGRQRDGSTSSSTIWRTCSSAWRMQSIELNGEGEPVWLIPYLRDPQPEREREGEHIAYMLSALCYCPSVCPSFHLFTVRLPVTRVDQSKTVEVYYAIFTIWWISGTTCRTTTYGGFKSN